MVNQQLMCTQVLNSPVSHPGQAVANAKAQNRDLPILTQKSNNALVETNQFLFLNFSS
jgi:hypothetical protein